MQCFTVIVACQLCFYSWFRFHYVNGQWTMAVNVPPEYSKLDQYRATLGHKANHGGEEEVRPKV